VLGGVLAVVFLPGRSAKAGEGRPQSKHDVVAI
jgi:hypothetical protein